MLCTERVARENVRKVTALELNEYTEARKLEVDVACN